MESLLDHYPVFEANQVLMSSHLNDAFDYLDQQERQTRSRLIGIGIVCGLEVRLAGSAIALGKGCGVTSEGYLIVEPEDVNLVAYRPYTLPTDLDYPPFKNDGTPFAMWELFEDGIPNTTPLSTPAGFLDDKAVLLFLELKKDALRNCSPNNCDDKGSQVTATVRRLLIARTDLDSIIAAAGGLGSGMTESDLVAALSARLNLPDLRLRRFDVPNTYPATSNDVYTAFLDMIRAGGLAQATGQALSAAYTAFQPLLAGDYASDPFTGFAAAYGFLDSAPTDAAQVRFLPYYADLFGDLLRAYDEFRWAGLELMCACCPDDGLFPRHLMLGLLHPESVPQPAIYRQDFLPSPAVGGCADKSARVRQLFARLVAMCNAFTDQPPLPKANDSLPFDPQIRITPSRRCCGESALEGEAIPYYYAQPGAAPVYPLWSPTLTRRRRANQNLGYNADLYDPAGPDFVTDPLRYDFGSRDFLRIEGHLGKDYQSVLRSLLTLKSEYRLPIDVIALRTGAYDPSQPVDLSQASARFQDLDAVYEALRGELHSQLAEGIMQFYDRPIAPVNGLPLNPGTPQLPLLQQYAPHYTYGGNTIGAWFESYLARFENQGYIEVDQNAVNPTAVMYLYCALFNGTLSPEQAAYPNVVAIYYANKLAEVLTPTLEALNYADFENKYQDLMALIRYFRSDAVNSVTPDLKNFLPEEEFIDQCEGVLMGCKLEAVKAVHDDFNARVGELRRMQFLSSFLQKEPGIQHRAGVPLGGTFIVVYHGDGIPNFNLGGLDARLGLVQAQLGRVALDMAAPAERIAGMHAADGIVTPSVASLGGIPGTTDASRLARAIGNLSANRALIQNDDLSLVVNWLTGQGSGIVPIGGGIRGSDDPAQAIIDATVGALDTGTVIADFFLPYRLSSASPGIEYVLPKLPPVFTVTVGCTGADGNASVTVQATGGVPPYDYAIDGAAYQPLAGPMLVQEGDHGITLRDAAGTETPPRTFTVNLPISLSAPTFTCASGNYTATATISGGVPPYQFNGKPLTGNTLVTDPVPSGTSVAVTVTDSRGCTLAAELSHVCPPPCTLPCAGASLDRNFRFFIPDPDANPNNAYQGFSLDKLTFVVEAVPGKPIDLTDQVAKILVANVDQLSAARFPATVNGWLASINKLIAATPGLSQAGKAQWLTLAYQSLGPGRMGVLSIDYFQCLQFNIQIAVTLALPNNKQSLQVAYTPQGTTVQIADTKVAFPAFDGTSADKCGDGKPVNICPVPPSFSVQIQGPTGATAGQALGFGVSVTGSADGLSFVWETQDGLPPMGSGPKFSTQFTTPGTKLVTVTAFDAKGCSASAAFPLTVNPASARPPIVRGNAMLKSAATKPSAAAKTTPATGKGTASKRGGTTRRGGK